MANTSDLAKTKKALDEARQQLLDTQEVLEHAKRNTKRRMMEVQQWAQQEIDAVHERFIVSPEKLRIPEEIQKLDHEIEGLKQQLKNTEAERDKFNELARTRKADEIEIKRQYNGVIKGLEEDKDKLAKQNDQLQKTIKELRHKIKNPNLYAGH